MTTIYIILAAVFLIAALVFWLVSTAKGSGSDEQRIKYQEAEIELRKKMADVDAAPDVDDPLSML